MFPSNKNNCFAGEALWRQTNNFGANYTLMTPLLKIPDVDGDGVQDLMIFTTVREEVQHLKVMIKPLHVLLAIPGVLLVFTELF